MKIITKKQKVKIYTDLAKKYLNRKRGDYICCDILSHLKMWDKGVNEDSFLENKFPELFLFSPSTKHVSYWPSKEYLERSTALLLMAEMCKD